MIVVEPGGFRTDFAGRSLRGTTTVIDDYADTAGPRRKENDTSHGQQPGDPARAARALMIAVASPEPPFLLMLGQDAVDAVRRELSALGADVDAWEPTSASTGFVGS